MWFPLFCLNYLCSSFLAMTTHIFICATLWEPRSDVRFLFDASRLYNALRVTHPTAIIKVYVNLPPPGSPFRPYLDLQIADAVRLFSADAGCVTELSTAGLPFLPPTQLPTDIVAATINPGDHVLLYLTNHGSNSRFKIDDANDWEPHVLAGPLSSLVDRGASVLLMLAFCGSGSWFRGLNFLGDFQHKPLSAIFDDNTINNTGGFCHIYHENDPVLMIGTQFLQKVLTYLSNYKSASGFPPPVLHGFHDDLCRGGVFSARYGTNNNDFITNYFGPNISVYQSSIVRHPKVQYFNLRKSLNNVHQLAPPTIHSCWTPRLQRLLERALGFLPGDKEVMALDTVALDKGDYISTVLHLLERHAFIIHGYYSGEFACFLLAEAKIPKEMIERHIEIINTEFNEEK